MKKSLIICLFVLLLPSVCFGWVGTQLQTGSSEDAKLIIVLMPSGFSDASDTGVGEETYQTEVTNNIAKLWENNFFAAYQQRFDVWRIDDYNGATVMNDAAIEAIIDADRTAGAICGNQSYGDSGTCKCIYVVVEDASGTDVTETNFVRLRNVADDDWTLAHEIMYHVLGKHSLFTNQGPILKDEYDCTGYTYSYTFSNIHDKNSNEKWSDLESGSAANCDSYVIPEGSTIGMGGTIQDAHNVAYKAAQIGLAKRSQDTVAYSALGTDFSGTKQYGQDTTDPTVVVEGIAGSKTYYGPTNIRVYATDAGTDIDRVEWYISTGGEYQTLCIDHTSPYTCYFDPNLYSGTMSVRIYTYDEAWNYAVNQYDTISYLHYERIGEGCTTAYFIDRDCDGYGLGKDYLTGMDADDKNIVYNTLKSVETEEGGYGFGDLDGCTGTDETCATRLKNWLAARTDKAYTSKADVFYVAPGVTGGAPNRVQTPYPTWAAAMTGGAASNDIIVFRDGTNTATTGTEWYSKNYSLGNELVLIGMPGEKPILSASSNGVSFSSGTIGYITFDNLIFLGAGVGSTFNANGASVITNLTTRYIEMITFDQFWRLQAWVKNNLWEYCIMGNGSQVNGSHDVYNSCVSGGYCTGNIMRGVIALQTIPSGVGIEKATTVQFGAYEGYPWSGLLIDKCIFHSNGARALTFECGHINTTVQNCVFFNNNHNDIQFYSYWSAGGSKCFATGVGPNASGPTVINNTFYRGLYHNGMQGSGTPPDAACLDFTDNTPTFTITGGIVRNNVFHIYGGTGDDDVSIINATPTNGLSGWKIEKNVIYKYIGTNIAKIDGTDYAHGLLKSTFPTVFDDYSDYSPMLDDVNINYCGDDGHCTGEPYQFNLDLTALSTNCINSGSTDSDPTDDIHGATRGLIPDIGADEYSFDTGGAPSATGCTMSGASFR